MSCINIVFPNQLFEKLDYFENKEVVLIEEFLFLNNSIFIKRNLFSIVIR